MRCNKRNIHKVSLITLTISLMWTPLVTNADSTTVYKYDSRGRLVQVSNNLNEKIYYKLDDAGNRAVVSNSEPTNEVPTIPKITLFSAPNEVAVGSFATIRWQSTNTTYCSLAIFGDSSAYSNLPVNGSVSIRINENTGVSLSCFSGDENDTEGKIIRTTSTGGGGFSRQ